MSKKYVPDGVWLTCSCGTCISQFKVTMHKLTTIYGSNMATEGDRWPFLNIKPFGLCSSRLSACVPSPVIWKNTKEGIFIGNNRMLLEDSQATCLFGGTISIHFSQISAMAAAPLGSFKKPSEYIKEGFDWTFDNLHKGTNALKSGLTKAGAPSWLLSGVDNLAWNIEFTQSITEGAVNAVVGLGEVVWDISQDPVGVGSAICGAVADGATSAWEWSTNGDNWVKLGNDSWDYVTSPDQWAETAKNAGDWIQKNPRILGNFAGEVLETIGEVVLTAGAASAAKKGIQKGVQKGVSEGLEKTVKEVAEEGIQKKLPKVVTKKQVSYEDLGKIEPCFLPGTMVLTNNGLKPIESLVSGETVFVYDFIDNCYKTKKISIVFNNRTKSYFKVTVNSKEIIYVTPGHLFWVKNYGRWEQAQNLRYGDELKSFAGGKIYITGKEFIDNVDLCTYNLEVEDIHNYFVGTTNLLVHNQKKTSKFDVTAKKEIRIYEVYDKKTGEVIYVGQTDKIDVEERFKEHYTEGERKGNHKKDWKRKCKIREVKRGNWTPYEASVWEQYYIEKNGGKGKLQNVRNEITEKKYSKYSSKHNPCG